VEVATVEKDRVELAYLALRVGSLEMALQVAAEDGPPFSQSPSQVDSSRTYRPTEVAQ
jgi:hypothetical protein